MHKTRHTGVGIIALATQLAALSCASSPSGDDARLEAAGSVGMNLTVAPGINLTMLNWTIRDAALATVLSSESSGQRPWSGGAAESLRFVIGGIPYGDQYTIDLTGSTSNGDNCTGTSEPFSVTAGSPGSLNLSIQCGVPGAGIPAEMQTGSLGITGTVTTVAGEPVACPGISAFSVGPTSIASSGEGVLSLATVGPAPSRIVWTSTAGTILSPNAQETALLCSGYQGPLTVTATLEGPAVCTGQPYTTQSETITCELSIYPDPPVHPGPPGSPCTANADCAGFHCVDQICGAYATTCRELVDRVAPSGAYILDTDGTGPNQPFATYCQLGSADLPPVGLCQAESGAPPACRSFYGAVGYDFVGVNFGGAMAEAGWLELQGQPVIAGHDVTELGDGTILANAYSSACCYSYAWTPTRYPLLGAAEPFGTGVSDGWGYIELFDQRILVGGDSQVAAVSRDESTQVTMRTTASHWPIQTQSGRILLPSRSVNEVLQLAPSGHPVTNTTNSAFLVGNVDSAIQLANGTVIIGVAGSGADSRLVFFDREMSPKAFTSAPRGMTLNADGSLTRSDLLGVGAMLQLPNGQVLIANPSSNTILRINPDGSYVDTFTLPATWPSPTGMVLDHRGRLLITIEATQQVHVVTFPGCSDGIKNGSETDVDCGGACTPRCLASQTCLLGSDCASNQCNSGVCQ